MQDHLQDSDLEKVQGFRGVVDSAPVADDSTKFQEFAEYLMEEDGLEPGVIQKGFLGCVSTYKKQLKILVVHLIVGSCLGYISVVL